MLKIGKIASAMAIIWGSTFAHGSMQGKLARFSTPGQVCNTNESVVRDGEAGSEVVTGTVKFAKCRFFKVKRAE